MTAKATMSPHFNITIQMDYKTIIALIQQLEEAERLKIWSMLNNEFSQNEQQPLISNTYEESSPPKVTLELIKKWEEEDDEIGENLTLEEELAALRASQGRR